MKFFILLTTVLLIACVPSKANERILNIQEVTSPGGIKAWFVKDNSVPIISLRFSFLGAGSIRDGEEKQGTAQLLSNTMDEGAGDLTSQEFQKQLSDHSITLLFNAGRDNFGGHVKTLTRHKEKAFDLLSLALTKPRFDAEPLERMRQSNITRIRSSMTQPDWITARLFNDIIFKGHPYALNSGGTLTTLQNIQKNDLEAFKTKWLTKDRLVVSVTGDITQKELSSLLDKIFGDLSASQKQKNVQKNTPTKEQKTYIYQHDIPQSMLEMAFPSFGSNDPDYYALKVMNYIFGGGGFGSRLMKEAREKEGLTYGIYSSLLEMDNYHGLTISTSTKNESAQRMKDIILAEIEKIKNNPISDDELKHAKEYITGSMPLALNSTHSISSILQNLQNDKKPSDYLDSFPNKINAVTAEDIQRVANRVLKTENMTTIIVGKPEGISQYKTLTDLPNVK